MVRSLREGPPILTCAREKGFRVNIQRGTFVSGAAAVALAFGTRKVSADSALRVAIQPSLLCTQAFCAKQMGIFKKHGLEVETQVLGSGAAIAAAMVGGSIDIGFGDPISLANGRLRGFNFAYIAAGFLNSPRYPTTGLLVRQDSGITDGKSLNGKTIGVNAINTLSTVIVQAWADKNGGDARQIKFIEVPFAQMVQDVDQSTVAAAFAGEPFFTIGHNRGLKVLLFQPPVPASTFMASGWFATDSWIAANHDTATAFSAAVREAAIWANANREAAAAIVEKELKLPDGTLHNLTTAPLFGEQLVDVQLIQPILDAAVKYNALAKPVHGSELIAKLR